MKIIRVTLLVCFFICLSFDLFAQSANGIRETYKRDTNRTIRIITEIKTSSSKGAEAAFFSAAYGFDGHAQQEFADPNVTVTVLGAEDLGDGPDLFLVFDGEKEGPFPTERTQNGEESGYTYQHFDVTWSTFRIVRKISAATTVKGQIGSVEFTMSPTTIRQIAALYSGMIKRIRTPNVLYSKELNQSMIQTIETDTINIRNVSYVDFSVDYKYPGKVQGKSIIPRVSMVFIKNPPIKDHRMLELKLWVDGNLAGTFPATYVSEDSESYKHGTLQLYGISEDVLRVIELIAGATTAKCSLGDMEFSLPTETISQIKTLWIGMHIKW